MMNSSASGSRCTEAARLIPTSNAPMAAPGTDPSPPMITTAKATMMTLTPSPGVTEIIGAVSAPPRAARNVTGHEGAHIDALCTFTPIVWLISESWMTARTTLPIRVRFSVSHTASPTTIAAAITAKS